MASPSRQRQDRVPQGGSRLCSGRRGGLARRSQAPGPRSPPAPAPSAGRGSAEDVSDRQSPAPRRPPSPPSRPRPPACSCPPEIAAPQPRRYQVTSGPCQQMPPRPARRFWGVGMQGLSAAPEINRAQLRGAGRGGGGAGSVQQALCPGGRGGRGGLRPGPRARCHGNGKRKQRRRSRLPRPPPPPVPPTCRCVPHHTGSSLTRISRAADVTGFRRTPQFSTRAPQCEVPSQHRGLGPQTQLPPPPHSLPSPIPPCVSVCLPVDLPAISLPGTCTSFTPVSGKRPQLGT